MHLVKAQPGVVADGSEAVDLGQTPGDIVVLSAADTELALHGGAVNTRGFLAYAATLIGRRFDWLEPAELPRAGITWPGLDNPGLNDLRSVCAKGRPVAALVFYRALVQADNVAPVRALIEALERNGVNCLALFCTSLKDPSRPGSSNRCWRRARRASY